MEYRRYRNNIKQRFPVQKEVCSNSSNNPLRACNVPITLLTVPGTNFIQHLIVLLKKGAFQTNGPIYKKSSCEN